MGGSVFGHNPIGKEFGQNDTQSALVMNTGGWAEPIVAAHNKAKAQKAAAEAAIAKEQAQENQIVAQSGELNDIYGVGTSQEAKKNAADIQAQETQATNEQEAASNNALDQQYQGAQQSSLAQAADSGNVGSSSAYDQARANLQSYVSGRQNAIVAAQTNQLGLQDQLNNQRLQQLGQIQQGNAANPDYVQESSGLQMQLTTAKQDVGQSAIAGAIGAGGQVAGNSIGTSALSAGAGPSPSGMSPSAAAAQSGVSLSQPGSSQTGTIS